MNRHQQNAAAARQLRAKGREIDVDTLRAAMQLVGDTMHDKVLNLSTPLQIAGLVAAEYRRIYDMRAAAIENE